MIKAPYFQHKLIERIPWVDNTSLYLTNGIPRDFPLKALVLTWKGRITIANYAAGVLNPEAPFCVINRIIVHGVHRLRGTEVILDLPAATLRTYNQFYDGQMTMDFQSIPLAAANATYDLQFQIVVPFALERVIPSQVLSTLLDCQQYNQLTLEIQTGQASWILDDAVNATTTFSAYNSAQGVPQITVERICGQLGADVDFKPGLVKRTNRSFTNFASQTATNQIMADLNVGNVIRSIMLKAGTRNALSPTVRAFTGWSTDYAVLGLLNMNINDTPIRQGYFLDLQGINCMQYGIRPADYPQGYQVFEFVENGDYNQGLVTFDFAARAKRLQLRGDLATPAAWAFDVIHTEIIPYKG